MALYAALLAPSLAVWIAASICLMADGKIVTGPPAGKQFGLGLAFMATPLIFVAIGMAHPQGGALSVVPALWVSVLAIVAKRRKVSVLNLLGVALVALLLLNTCFVVFGKTLVGFFAVLAGQNVVSPR
ncbi:MAG TPA: hypothetical protein VGK67_35895 [Myxococcales bacterium]